MATRRPHVRTIPLSCAPSQAPCPTCGKRGRRKQVLRRLVRTLAYKQVVFLDITYGEYRARCGCCSTFRTCPPGVEPKAAYDHKVREAVLDRILDDGMSVERVIASMRRDFLLDLSDGFVYDCLDRRVRGLDMAEHRRWILTRFSGTLCVDELHLGRSTLLLATDPLQDLPVAFAVVAGDDRDHMRRFLKDLKWWGLLPQVVVTDGSNLYPTLLAELWPAARHQLCVFHVLKDLHQRVLDAVRRMRRGLSRRGNRGRKRKPGRPRRRSRRRLTNKEKSAFVFKHRWLIVKRREGMSAGERADLETMLSYLPELKTLRDFVDRLTMLFEEGQTEELARGRHAALLGNPRFQKVPELSSAMGMLPDEKFAKMIAFLKDPACRRVRTNNHVERVNRQLRHEEKARYKWRERRTIVRFLVLLMDRRYKRERAIRSRWHGDPGPSGDDGCSPKAVPRGRVA
ncbi:transposase [Singulisphaera sp. PoT]|uniref:transposase n=2 Tax=Singulisphaera sp. PoT TaxID=3411797 RepID=UPI003BF47AEF